MDQNTANFDPLSPVDFLVRAATVFPDKIAIIHSDIRYTYREFHQRCCRLATALAGRGIVHGDTVAIMAPNIPAMLEAHYGVPMLGAVLNPLNIRLDSRTIAFALEHGEAKILLTDREYSGVIKDALAGMANPPLVIDIDDNMAKGGVLLGETDYETLLQEGTPRANFEEPKDEWQTISLLYTSGTTGNPKGVLYHHRGAYLNTLGNMTTFGLDRHSVYLWTLPMFHCNGWTFTWAVTAACGTHVCLRDVDPAQIYPMIADHGVTHMCGAPIVLTMLESAPDEVKTKFPHTVEIATGGAAPPSSVIQAMELGGFRVTHLYGMTETYGPSLSCVWQDDWSGLDHEARSAKMARQGVRYLTLRRAMVADPDTMADLPWDGETIGELMLAGNTVMKGYLKNPAATAEALRGGWLHTGDLAVRHPDGYFEIKDRAKDVIISGGENISSIEVEEALYHHPKVLEAAVVAKPHPKWGESPCAFVTLRQDMNADAKELIAFCRENMAGFKVPKNIVVAFVQLGDLARETTYTLRERAKMLGQTQ